jgi:hypothetical protein
MKSAKSEKAFSTVLGMLIALGAASSAQAAFPPIPPANPQEQAATELAGTYLLTDATSHECEQAIHIKAKPNGHGMDFSARSVYCLDERITDLRRCPLEKITPADSLVPGARASARTEYGRSRGKRLPYIQVTGVTERPESSATDRKVMALREDGRTLDLVSSHVERGASLSGAERANRSRSYRCTYQRYMR